MGIASTTNDGSNRGLRRGSRFARLAAGAAALACAGLASAQGVQTGPQLTMEGPASVTMPEQIGMTWTQPQFGEMAKMLIGSWKTPRAVPLAPGAAGEPAAVTMPVAPVNLAGVPDAMYVEVAREDGLHDPYYQAVFQLYATADGSRLRTYEFRAPDGLNPGLFGLWAATDQFPEIGRSDLVARIDMDLAGSGSGFVGRTPYPYPTARGGAMEMTSELQLQPGSLRTSDRGFDASGAVVWGGDGDASFEFTRYQPDVRVRRFDGGLMAISFAGGEGDVTVGVGNRVVLDYTGYLASGRSFDSSFKPGGRPLDYITPGSLIPGWQSVSEGMTKGERRRLIIPPAFGYGQRGNPRAGISGTDTLFFDVDLIGLEDSQPTSQAAPNAAPTVSGNAQPLTDQIRQQTGVSRTGEIQRTQPATQERISPAKENPGR